MSKSKSAEWVLWLKANGHKLGFLTGTDSKALAAFVPMVELYAYCGHLSVLRAAGVAMSEAQLPAQQLARELIAFVLDWGDRERLWPHVEYGIAEGKAQRPMPAFPALRSDAEIEAEVSR